MSAAANLQLLKKNADLRSFRDPALDTLGMELATKILVLEAVIAAMTRVAREREAWYRAKLADAYATIARPRR